VVSKKVKATGFRQMFNEIERKKRIFNYQKQFWDICFASLNLLASDVKFEFCILHLTKMLIVLLKNCSTSERGTHRNRACSEI